MKFERRARWNVGIATKTLMVAAILLLASLAEATLIDLNNGLVFDSVDNIYWTKDANLSPTLPWDDIVAWAETVTVANLSDFRLASLPEYRSLYNQLIALGVCGPLPVTGGRGPDCSGSIGPFTNIRTEYWTSTIEFANLPIFFPFVDGNSTVENFFFPDPGWAVHAAVPESSALWLILTGAVLIVLRRLAA
jgi:hypothetical protein